MWLIRHRRIARCALIIAIAAVTVIAHDGIDAQAPKRLALVGGMLVTGYEVPPIHHAAVLVEGNKIVAAGPAAEVKIPADASVVDTSGRAMLPGLIETHGHLIVLGHGSYDTWFPWIKAHGGDAMLTRVMEISAKQLLMAGVTTTIDLGAPLQPILSMRDRINKGEAYGTRLFVSGPWISRGAGGAMQDGFGGINISTPEEAAHILAGACDFAIIGPGQPEVIRQALAYVRPGGVAISGRSAGRHRPLRRRRPRPRGPARPDDVSPERPLDRSPRLTPGRANRRRL